MYAAGRDRWRTTVGSSAFRASSMTSAMRWRTSEIGTVFTTGNCTSTRTTVKGPTTRRRLCTRRAHRESPLTPPQLGSDGGLEHHQEQDGEEHQQHELAAH